MGPVTKKKKVSPPKNVEEFRKRLDAINNIPISFSDDPAMLLKTKSEGRVAHVYSRSLVLCTEVLESGTKDAALLKAARKTGDKLRSNLSVVVEIAGEQKRVKNSIDSMVGMGRVNKRIEDYEKAREADRRREPPEPDVKKARVVLASATPGKVAASEAEASETGKQVPTDKKGRGKYIMEWLGRRIPWFNVTKERIKINQHAYETARDLLDQVYLKNEGRYIPVSELSENEKRGLCHTLDVEYTAIEDFSNDVKRIFNQLERFKESFESEHTGNTKLIEDYKSMLGGFETKPFPKADWEFAKALGHTVKKVDVYVGLALARREFGIGSGKYSPDIMNADYTTGRPVTAEEKDRLKRLDDAAGKFLDLLDELEKDAGEGSAKGENISSLRTRIMVIIEETKAAIVMGEEVHNVQDIVALLGNLGARIKGVLASRERAGKGKPEIARAARKPPAQAVKGARKELKEVKGKIASLRERVRGGEVKGEEKVKLQRRIYKLKQKRDDLSDALARKEEGKTGGLAMARKKEKGERA